MTETLVEAFEKTNTYICVHVSASSRALLDLFMPFNGLFKAF